MVLNLPQQGLIVNFATNFIQPEKILENMPNRFAGINYHYYIGMASHSNNTSSKFSRPPGCEATFK